MPYTIKDMVGGIVTELPGNVLSILMYVLGQLVRLPGVLSSEVDLVALLNSIQKGIGDSPPGSTLAVETAHAITQILKDQDLIFIKSDWFKGLAVEVLRMSQIIFVL